MFDPSGARAGPSRRNRGHRAARRCRKLSRTRRLIVLRTTASFEARLRSRARAGRGRGRSDGQHREVTVAGFFRLVEDRLEVGLAHQAGAPFEARAAGHGAYGVRRARPLARRAFSTRRPFLVACGHGNRGYACRCRTLGWKVRSWRLIRLNPVGFSGVAGAHVRADAARKQGVREIRSGPGTVNARTGAGDVDEAGTDQDNSAPERIDSAAFARACRRESRVDDALWKPVSARLGARAEHGTATEYLRACCRPSSRTAACACSRRTSSCSTMCARTSST